MTEQANRIDWLERQLAQVESFIKRDLALLEESPGRFSLQVGLNSWKSHQEELLQELRQAKSALQHEVVQLRLMGMRMDGSIPLKLLSKISNFLNSTIAHAAYHLRHGMAPARGLLDSMSREIDLRLSGLALGSTRLVFAGNIAPDTTGDSPMESALEQIFEVLDSSSAESIRELVTVIGVPATRSLSELLGTLEKLDIGAELTWSAPNSKVYHWGGNLSSVREAHSKLSVFEQMQPELVSLSGLVSELKENGALYIRNGSVRHKISYNKQQYQHIQQLSLGMSVTFKAMKYTRKDPVSEIEITTYKLVTE